MNRVKEFFKSLSYALRGLGYVLENEKNFQNEVIAAIAVIVAMIYFRVSETEMIILFAVIMGVLIMELLNTVMERVVDIVKPQVHPYARLIKDLMAASVLIMAVLSVIVGIIIFVPYLTPKILALLK